LIMCPGVVPGPVCLNKGKIMFVFLANLTNKLKIPIILLWLAAAVALLVVAPDLSDVGVTDESQFLPQDTESAMADNIIKQEFGSGEAAGSSGFLLFYNPLGLSETDMQQAAQMHDWLLSGDAPAVLQGVTSVFESDSLRTTLISADGTAMIMPLEFSVSPLESSAKQAVAQIRAYSQGNFPGSRIYLSGGIGLLGDMFQSVQDTIGRTTIVTLILVVILLFIIYRSPVASLIPLITIGLSFLVARGILGYMAAAGMAVSTLAEAYLVVVIFGVGTDYCLFIVSRFREELAKSERQAAQRLTLSRIGPVILASAVTVIVAFMALGISRFGMNTTTGYAMAIGVAFTLVAGLTLTPALIALFGRFIFWPARTFSPSHKEGRFGWQAIGRWVSRHPLLTALPIILLLLAPYVFLPRLTRSADIISQMPQSAESVQGFNLFKERFPAGEFNPLYLVVQLPAGQTLDAAALPEIERIASDLSAVAGVSKVDYYAAPVPELQALASQAGTIKSQLASGVPPLTTAATLQTIGQYLSALPLQYPGVLQSQNFRQSSAALQQIPAILAQLTSAMPESTMALLTQLQTNISVLAGGLNGLVQEFALETSSPFTDSLLTTYFSHDRTAARLNIIFSMDPYSSQAQQIVAQLKETAAIALSQNNLREWQAYLGGDAATHADILAVNDSDFIRVTILATVGIFIVIALLLRSLVAPLYMVVTVLLNYGTTLGISTWLFLDLLHKGSIIYLVPLFVFVILVALGADYNIFLMSRLREESHHYPPKQAVANAIGSTGGVITACGIILAGTFATLTTSALQVVLQVGAATAIGLVIDTFIVRALLVPAIAAMVGRVSWWPSRLAQDDSLPQPEPAAGPGKVERIDHISYLK
jgi:RND superfamily putative drug exporter